MKRFVLAVWRWMPDITLFILAPVIFGYMGVRVSFVLFGVLLTNILP